MVTCIVKGCRSRSDRASTPRLRYFQIPKVVQNRCKEAEFKSARRRALWISRLNKPGLLEEDIKDHIKVCSLHFIKGAPAHFACENDPDWAPSLCMGVIHNTPEDQKNKEEIVALDPLDCPSAANMSEMSESKRYTMENTVSAVQEENAQPKDTASPRYKRRKLFWKRAKSKRWSRPKTHNNKQHSKSLPAVSIDPPELYTEENNPEDFTNTKIKTEVFDTSPPQTPSTLSNTESIPDQYKMEGPDIKVEDFDMENGIDEDGYSEESGNREMEVITGDLPDANAGTESSSILHSALMANAGQSRENSSDEPGTIIDSKTHLWESSVAQPANNNSSGSLPLHSAQLANNNLPGALLFPSAQLANDSASGSLVFPSGESFQVKSIFIFKRPPPADLQPPPADLQPPPADLQPPSQEVRDPLEINPHEVVNSLEVTDPLAISKKPSRMTDLLMTVKQKLDFLLFAPWHALIHFDAIHAIFVSSKTSLCIQRSIVFSIDGDVELYVHRESIDASPFLDASQPVSLTVDSVQDFVDRIRKIVLKVSEMHICRGISAEKYKPVWKTCTFGRIDVNLYDEYSFKETFRSLQCLMLVKRTAQRCSECAKLTRPLRIASEANTCYPDSTVSRLINFTQKYNK